MHGRNSKEMDILLKRSGDFVFWLVSALQALESFAR